MEVPDYMHGRFSELLTTTHNAESLEQEYWKRRLDALPRVIKHNEELAIWWQAYLAALSGPNADLGVDIATIASNALEDYQSKLEELAKRKE